MTFVSLRRLSPYDVCHLMTFVTYDDCCIMMFVSYWYDVCRIMAFVSYDVCRIMMCFALLCLSLMTYWSMLLIGFVTVLDNPVCLNIWI